MEHVALVLSCTLVSSQVRTPIDFRGENLFLINESTDKHKVRFTWKDTSDSEKGFKIQRYRGGFYWTIAKTGSNVSKVDYNFSTVDNTYEKVRVVAYKGLTSRKSKEFNLLMGRPDFNFYNLSINSRDISVGSKFTCTSKVSNIGNHFGQFKLRFYLSKDNYQDDSDILLATHQASLLGYESEANHLYHDILELGTEVVKKTTITMKKDITPGDYVLIVKVESDRPEISNSNNIQKKSIRVFPPSDLKLTTINFPNNTASGGWTQVDQNGNLNTDITCKNIGRGYSTSAEIKLYFSKDGDIDSDDISVGSVSVGGLAPDESDSRHIAAYVPGHISGYYYLIAVVDKNNHIYEDNEDNNTITGKVYIRKVSYGVLLPLEDSNIDNLKGGQYVFDNVEVKNEEKVIINPNPCQGIFKVNGLKGISVVEVYDIKGKLLVTKNISSLEEVTLDVTNNGKGTFIVRLIGKDKIIVDKVIVK